MNKFDSTIIFPSTFSIVKVYYKSEVGEFISGELGFWTGEKWNRLNQYMNGRWHGTELKNVTGWEKIIF